MSVELKLDQLTILGLTGVKVELKEWSGTAYINELQAPRQLAKNLGGSGAPTQIHPPKIRAI